MYVVKRDGRQQPVFYDKITARNKQLASDLSVDTAALSQTVIRGLNSGMTTRDIDRFSAESAIHRSIYEPDYGILASRIAWNDLHKNTPETFNDCIDILYNNFNQFKKKPNPLISEDVYTFAKQHIEKIEKAIDYKKDYEYSYFAFRTLEKSYLQKSNKETTERMQHMLMRVNLGIHGPSKRNGIVHQGDINKALESYKAMSERKFIHATPTLFNSGTTRPQMSSCFLLDAPDSMGEDEYDEDEIISDTPIEEPSIPECWKHCAKISKFAGGIGVSITAVRCRGSYIAGTNGRSNGIIPLVTVFNQIGRYVDQCFTPDTIVYTNTGPKAIEDIVMGDKVYTEDGTLQEVLEIKWDRLEKSLHSIETLHSLPVWCTSKHPFFSIQVNDNCDANRVISQLKLGLVKPEYIEIDKLNIGDLIGFPVPQYEKDINSISLEDCRFYGICISNGSYMFSTHSITLFLTEEDKSTLDFIESYLCKKGVVYSFNSETSFIEGIKSSNMSIQLNNRIQLNQNYFLNETGESIIHHNYLNLPKEKIIQIIYGMLEVSVKSKNYFCKQEDIDYYYNDTHIVEYIKYLFLRLGYLVKIDLQKDTLKIPYSNLICNMFDIPNESREKEITHFIYNNVIYTPIIKTNTKKYNGVVIDLVVEKNSNYLTQSGLVHNGGGKRKGAISIYLEPWHPDTPEFLEIRLPTGAEELRARDIFPALWIPDLFFKRIQEDGEWSFFCPGSYPELIDLYGEEFEQRYVELEREGKMVRQMKARELWEKILKSLTESGLPYMLSKDSCNLKSNQKNVGTVRGSNLCVAPETYILTDKGQIQIKELSGQEVNVWNGEKWSRTTVLKTGEQQKLITVYLSNGSQITCTPYHKFIIEKHNDTTTIKNATRIEASELKIDMKLKTFSLPDKNQYNISVVSIVDEDRFDDTYCFNEPENHAGVFNGVLTGNCTEIIEYHDPKSIAVCNLASINLAAFVNKDTKTYDFTELGKIVEMATENLDLIIDKNYSPVRYCAKNNLDLRPIGLGVQGLADTFAMLHISWETEEAQLLNKIIFETIYYHALKKSSEIAQTRGSYSHFEGSPASKGILQYDMWNVVPVTSNSVNLNNVNKYTWTVPFLDWSSLKESVKKGLRNSLLVAPMPTAGTSQIMGNNESFEPFTSNIYVRKVVAGDFPLVNSHLYRDLNDIGKWNKDTVDKIIKNNGSVQQLDIPEELKNIYKTVWEIPQRVIIDMAADRGAFIDQSQSMNIYLERPTSSKLSSMYIYGWKKGLKTLSYYLRSQPAVDAVKFTLMEVSDPTQKIKEEMSKESESKITGKKGEYICTDEVCIPCSS